ncbi:MAG TPA: serine hydrolase, partial [Cytophagales bacterium]|nr:serine hydrolase [Cytophagales bacterium]
GSQYVYSGAAYTLLQLVMEEVSGLPFTDFMDQEVLQPLGMEHSTFDYSATSQFSKALVYQVDGRIREPKRFTALAAAGLYTCTADLGKFLLANLSDPSVLNPSTLQTMATAETFINQVGVYGLGPHLYSQNDANSQIIGHDGSGNNAINTAARVDLMSRSGIIILETGHYDLASSLADEWLFWKAGVYDFVVMTRNRSYLLTLLVSGYVVLLLGFGLVLVRSRKK